VPLVHARLVIVLALGGVAGVAIGGASGCAQDTGSCIPGTIGCICEMSGTCDTGLLCRENRCVSQDDDPTDTSSSSGVPGTEDGGSESSGGTTGAPLECNGTTLRVASYNVQAVGFAESDQWNALGEMLRRLDADVVCIEELEDGETGPLRELTMALGYGEPVQADTSPGIGGELRNACLGRVPLSRIDSFTASDLSSDPQANDLGRDIIAVRAQKDGCAVNVLAVHAKSGQESIDWFRRQVETVRLVQAIAAVREEFPDDAVVVMGDFNESPDDPAIGTVFDEPPLGLPESYRLGSDIEFPLEYAPFTAVESTSLAIVDATQEDSEYRNTWSAFEAGDGVRLDYLWVPETDDALAMEAVVVFNPCFDDGVDAAPAGAWLPLAGEPLPCWVGPAASDHLPIVADLRVP
jgi:endonuclease/exonuclease/phosphatase family metal-dependent hydrolase